MLCQRHPNARGTIIDPFTTEEEFEDIYIGKYNLGGYLNWIISELAIVSNSTLFAIGSCEVHQYS